MNELTITRPDDFHLHLRDGILLRDVLSDSAKRFGRAIIMPNLRPPIINTDMAIAYRSRIVELLEPGSDFEPLMTLYLTDMTSPDEIVKAKNSGLVHGVKLYPSGATTNSDSGVTNIRSIYKTLEKMESVGMPLLVHAEVTDPEVDVFDRELVFIERHLKDLLNAFQGLKVVFEHITTKDAVDFVEGSSGNIAATITSHHLLMNRNSMFSGGIRPHHYCLPVLKREVHRIALLKAATSGNPKFFLGTDSAPHPKSAKESSCGCAGIYTSHAAIELYAEAFEKVNALDKLEAFASFFGADFYQLPRNAGKITLIRKPWNVPEHFNFGTETLVPLRAGMSIEWSMSSLN